MKTKFKNNAEVCHIWAQQKQENGVGSNIFFEGPSIYSYGHHFEMARFIKPSLVFTTTRGYSNSTSKHLNLMHRAISHIQSFDVPSFDNHDENVKYYLSEIDALKVKIPKSTLLTHTLVADLFDKQKTLEKYIGIFKRDISKPMLALARKAIRAIEKLDYSALLKKCEARKAEREAAYRIHNEQAMRRRAIVQAEHIAEWRAGNYHGSLYDAPMMLRLDGEYIQTSQGARVLVNEALNLYLKLKAGEPVHGTQLSDYTVTGYDGETLTVGCHKIPMIEMERMYNQLVATPVVA